MNIISQSTEYRDIHYWLANNYGKANKCENKDCTYKNPKRYTWALIKGKKYEYKREHFMQLCCSCHIKYDLTLEKVEKCRQNNIGEKCPNAKLNEKQVRIIKHLKNIKPKMTGIEVAKIFKVSSTQIGKIWKGLAWEHIKI